jgi:hypothetical protein
MCALLRERMADALPQPAITARHQCNNALEVHRFSPFYCECADASRRLSFSVTIKRLLLLVSLLDHQFCRMPRRPHWLSGQRPLHNTVIATCRALRLLQLGLWRLLL